ncbi:MAG: DUF2318 domain-containing protein [Nitrospirae bacterium]|nr:DUF2318 domain-containing protein [Nitrospirota bacterium]
MMNSLLLGAELVGLKEGFKALIVWFVFYSYLVVNNKKNLIRPFYAGFLSVCLILLTSFFLPQGLIPREYLGNVIAMSFAIFLILSAAALLYMSGDLPGKDSEAKFIPVGVKETAIANVLIFFSTVLFFLPDSMGIIFYLKEIALMADKASTVYLYALIGLAVSLVIFIAVVKFYKPYWIGSFFDIPQILLFLAMVKLLGGGIKGIAELSLIPSVQRGFIKFIHDIIHQTLVLAMVPDHPLLKPTTWNFIGIFFGTNIASIASLILLLLFPLMFIYHSLFKPLPEPEAQTNAQRRKIKSFLLSDRRKKALPVIFFICLILIAWFSQGSEQVTRLYNPKPGPVVADKGVVVIPLTLPGMDLTDGLLHKFSLIHDGDEIRIIIIKKSSNALAVCLDACEICPPEGYAQREDHVVCIYCGTPIAIDTLSEPGGCNPIPLETSVDALSVKIELSEILKKWGFVTAGSNKGKGK